MDELPDWDGKDEHMAALACRVSSGPLGAEGFHTWMLGLASQWMGVSGRCMPTAWLVLVSREQGTTEIQLLSRLDARRAGTLLHRQPETDLAGTSREDAGGNGAAQYGRVRQVCRQQNALTEKSDADVGTQRIRKAYQQNFRQLPRIASFIGTSNRFDLLTDPTGRRRFLCIEVKHNID